MSNYEQNEDLSQAEISYGHAVQSLRYANLAVKEAWCDEQYALSILVGKAQGYIDKFGIEILDNLTPELKNAYLQSLSSQQSSPDIEP